MWPEPDGMATLSAYLPAAEAVGVFAVLDEYARRAGCTGDERSMDPRRGDALVDPVLNPTGYRSAGTSAVRARSTEPGDPPSGHSYHSEPPPLTDPEPVATRRAADPDEPPPF